MDARELVVGKGEGHLVAGVETGEHGVGGLDESLDALMVLGGVGEGEGVADGGHIGLVGRLIRLRLDPDLDVLIVVEHRVDRLEEALVGQLGILGFADVRPFAGEPEHDGLGADGVGDVDALLGAIPGVGAIGGAVGSVGAVDGLVGEPQTRGDELRREALVGEHRFYLGGLLLDLIRLQVIHARHDVVVMELHALEAEGAIEGEFLLVGEGLADVAAEGVAALADVPGAERESIRDGGAHEERTILTPGAGIATLGVSLGGTIISTNPLQVGVSLIRMTP